MSRPLELLLAATLGPLLPVLSHAAPPPLEVEFADCAEVLAPAAAPTCVLEEGAANLRIWARSGAATRITVLSGARLLATPELRQGGWLFRLEARPQASRIVVQAAADGGSARFVLPLAWRADEGDSAATPTGEKVSTELDRARALQREADHTATEDPARAAELYAAAAETYERHGHLASSIHVLTLQHYLLYSVLGDDRGAQRALDAVPEAPRGDASSSIVTAFYRTLWNIRLGRLRAAWYQLEEAKRRAERLADVFWQNMFLQPQSYLASHFGLFDLARRTAARLRPLAGDLDRPCRRAELLNNLGWSQLLILEAGAAAEPVADLEAARRLAVGCSGSLPANIALNLALAHLHAGDVDEARRALEQADRGAPNDPAFLLEWRLDVAGRLALLEDRPEAALELFGELESAAGHELPGVRWRALIGRGQTLEALGRAGEALDAYAAADEILDSGELDVPLADGRGPELGYLFYERGTRRHLDLLLRLDRPPAALELARRSRRRALRKLLVTSRLDEASVAEVAALRHEIDRLRAQRRTATAMDQERLDRQQRELEARLETERAKALESLSSTGLAADPVRGGAPPRPAELMLVYHPLPEGWVGFALGERGLETATIDLDAPESASRAALAKALLAPFATAIAAAQRVRILPYGALWRIDFHALPLDGGTLLDQVPVAYSLDLPPVTAAAHGRAAHGRALLIEDLTRSLAHAPAEIRAVASALGAVGGWEVEILEAAAAGPAALREAWDDRPVDLFHFAGHADVTGGDRLGAGLVLGGGQRLSLADILARGRGPDTVVLSACAAAGQSGAAPVGVGAGQAFLLAGSRQVIAPAAPIDDATAAALVELFYRHWPAADAASALRLAQLALRDQAPGSGWARFRILER